ncbi:MAG: TetR/AcrR family transcriptional regulator [Solirubrobacteraceae bacterium]
MTSNSNRGAPSRRTAEETREHILAVTENLFYSEGIHATGIDTLAARADVAPTTLYRQFASKDDLVAAYVERCSERYKTILRAAASPGAGTPRDRILAAFDAFAAEIRSGSCRGCPFLMVLAEYPDPESPAHAKAAGHKAWLRALFHKLVRELASTTQLRDPEALADQLALVAEGIYGSVQALGPAGPAAHGRATAAALIESARLDRARLTEQAEGDSRRL